MCSENHYWHHDYVRLAWDSGFNFSTHRAKLNYDWSHIGLLDIDRVVRDRDVAVIEKHMPTILNYSLDEEQTKILEPTFVKVFQLSQLSMQYLQFCKRYLDNTVVLLKKELSRQKQENSDLKSSVGELKEEIVDLKKKVKELKQSVQPQITPENLIPASFKCNICCKMFVNEEFLIAHMKRRHEIDNNLFQTETDRLQLEIKELKERLNSTEKYIQNDSNTKLAQSKSEPIPNNDAVLEIAGPADDLKDKFDHLKTYVERELTTLREEKHYQEKYEKWFELVFQRLDNSQNELQGKQEVLQETSDEDKLVRKDSSTQTISGKCVESQTMTEDASNVVSEENVVAKPVTPEIDVQKIENDIRLNTESHLDQIQGVLEQKLSGGIEKIQTQMDTFWKKLSDLELEKKRNNNNTNTNDSQFDKRSSRSMSIKTKPLKNLYLSSDSSASNISLEEAAPIKTIPVPAPRIHNQNKGKEIKPQVKMVTPIRKATVVKPKIEQAMIETSSEEESSSSDDTVEIIKPPVYVTPVKKITKTELLKNKYEKSKIPVKYSKPSKEEPEISLESETEEDIRIMPPQNKPSTSTLGQRSVTSLKQTIKDQSVIKGLNKEILKMVNLRLREIGISPHWKGIPEKSYQQATRVVNHQTELSKRRYPNYLKIHDSLLKILDERVNKELKGSKSDVEEKTNKLGKMLVLKKYTARRHTKHTKLKQNSNNNPPIEINNEHTQPKPQIRQIKEFSEKENRVQQSTSIPQDKPILVTATPIKKKVLFDLEDALTASKTVTQPPKVILETPQRRQNSKDDHQLMGIENTTIVSGSGKIENKPMDNEGIGGTLKPQKVSKINDGGSISSLGSSFLEVPKGESKQDKVPKDDLSDWDISDILT